MTGLTYGRDGAELHRAALASAALSQVEQITQALPAERAGIRLTGIAELRPLLAARGAVGRLAAAVLGEGAQPVRAILFDKTARTNWAVGWHQDRTIAVRQRSEVPGYGPWSVKGGIPHVAQPAALLAGMVTLRIHLDPVGPENAPLLVAPGSHRLGRVPETEIVAAVVRHGTATCLAEPGDVWLYATLILHASEAAAAPVRRRVLQVDFSAASLPAGLDWLGV